VCEKRKRTKNTPPAGKKTERKKRTKGTIPIEKEEAAGQRVGSSKTEDEVQKADRYTKKEL